MNLNTLAAQEADYKSGSLPVALYPNAMRREADGKQTFFARPIIREHLSMDDIASDMVVAGVNNGMSREQIVSTWKNINCAVLDRVANSCSVDTGLCLCSTRISGTFATDSEAFSRERHGIDMAFRTNSYVRDKLAEPDTVDPGRIFITHSGVDPVLVEKVRAAVLDCVPFREVLITRAGCTISSHCGPNCLGILFYRK